MRPNKLRELPIQTPFEALEKPATKPSERRKAKRGDARDDDVAGYCGDDR